MDAVHSAIPLFPYYELGCYFLVATLERTLTSLMKPGGPFTCYIFASHGYPTVLCGLAIFAWICGQECMEYLKEIHFLHCWKTTFLDQIVTSSFFAFFVSISRSPSQSSYSWWF
jgi:hypothetical protein